MILEIQNLTKVYKGNVAIQDFSCTFTHGITGILGPNGAGKSTLIHLITDNVKRDSGTITLDSCEILQMKEKYREQIGVMPQEQSVYDQFSAETFLYYMAELKGIKKIAAKKQIEELLRFIGLYEVRHKRLEEYSGGMKQRILFAQALLGNPRIVILDEPTAGLDIEERLRMTEYIKSYAQNRIVLWCTHIVSDIENVASKVLVMKEGKKVAFLSIREMLENTETDNLEAAYLKYMKTQRG